MKFQRMNAHLKSHDLWIMKIYKNHFTIYTLQWHVESLAHELTLLLQSVGEVLSRGEGDGGRDAKEPPNVEEDERSREEDGHCDGNGDGQSTRHRRGRELKQRQQ